MPEFRRFSYDVLVIGAGGAGLRAAVEAAANGATVGVVCKSLLGKAHIIMAEGGIVAALANVDDRDNWRVHFADTMSVGSGPAKRVQIQPEMAKAVVSRYSLVWLPQTEPTSVLPGTIIVLPPAPAVSTPMVR